MDKMHCGGGGRCKDPASNNDKMVKCPKKGIYFSVKTYEVCLCSVAIDRIRVYHVDFFVFFVLHHG